MSGYEFKAWDTDNNCWFEPTYEAYRGNLEELLMSQGGRLCMRTTRGMADESTFEGRFIVCRSAGLKDKNGVKIYEGDIVRQYWMWGNHEDSDEGTFTGKVVVIPSKGVCLKNPVCVSELDDEARATNSYISVRSYRSEVIGNIYENPELLELNS